MGSADAGLFQVAVAAMLAGYMALRGVSARILSRRPGLHFPRT